MGTAIAGAVSIPVLNFVHAPGIISTEAMILVKERSFSPEVLFILAVVLLEIAILPRFWCRLFCPTGAFISLFPGRFTLGIKNSLKTPKASCCKENYCSSACRWAWSRTGKPTTFCVRIVGFVWILVVRTGFNSQDLY